jgi:hypothetical protein
MVLGKEGTVANGAFFTRDRFSIRDSNGRIPLLVSQGRKNESRENDLGNSILYNYINQL